MSTGVTWGRSGSSGMKEAVRGLYMVVVQAWVGSTVEYSDCVWNEDAKHAGN